jgi:hypothetical protein
MEDKNTVVEDYIKQNQDAIPNECIKVNKNAIICINKCGSSTIRAYANKKVCTDTDYAFKNYFVVVRDPLDRWFSGLTEYILELRKNLRKKYHKKIYDYIFKNIDQVKFDRHTARQIEFIRINNVEFFLFNDNGIQKLYERLNMGLPQHRNSSIGIPEKTRIQAMLKEHINESTLQKVFTYYKDDYELIKKHFPNYKFLEKL